MESKSQRLQDKALISEHGWQLKGDHNLLNAAAVCEVINVLGLNIMTTINQIKHINLGVHYEY